MYSRLPDLAIRHCLALCLVLVGAALAGAYFHDAGYLKMAAPFMAWASLLLIVTASLIGLLRALPNLSKDRSALQHWPALARRQFRDPLFWTDYVAPTGIVALLLFLFAALKQLIPVLHPYYADLTLMHLDRALHGGVLPHEYLMQWMGPGLLFVLDLIYPTLFPVCLIFFIFMARQKQLPAARYAFMVGFCLCWLVIGLGGGIAFSSMGPCYFHIAVPGNTTYTPLMNWISSNNALILRHGDQNALTSPIMQQYLLLLFKHHQPGFGAGISAMPSVHAAIPTLMVWAGFQRHRWLGIFSLTYLILIMLATVALGWHYAVDLYAAVFVTTLLWFSLYHYAAKRLRP